MTGLEREVQINHADKGFVAMHAAAHLALLQAAPAVFFERTVKIASSLCGMQAAGLYLSEDGKVVPRAVHERTQVKWPEACHTLAANVVRSALCDEQTLSPVVLEEKSAGSDEEPLRLVGIPLANRAREVFGALLLVGPGKDEFAEDQFQSLEVLGSCISCDMESLVELFRRERAARRVQSVQRLSSISGWEYWLSERELVLSPEARAVVGVSDLDRFVTAHVGLRLIPADSRSRLFSAFRKTLEGHGAFAEEFEVRESRREVRYFLVSAELVEADAFLPRRLAGIVREVTDRRRAQMALKASEQEQMRLLANLPGIAYRCDCEMPWPMLMVSEGARDLCGYPPEALLREGNVRYADLIHPDDLERVSTEIEVALRERRPFRLTYRIFPPDREVKWVWEQGRAIRDEEGKVLYLEGFIGDITDQRRIAQRLHQSEERFRLLSEATNDTLWDLDMASHRLWWSDGLRRVFGLERIPDSTFDKTWSPRVHPSDLNRVLQEIREAITRGDETFETHYRFLRADGSFAEVTDRGQIIRDEDGRAYRMVGGMVDVSERRELEAQFFRAQRMESIGGLASGIAHDLNNLLSPIVMGMQLLQRTEQTPKSLRIISEIERSALRGTELVKQVLSFARGIDGQRIPIRLKHLFAELEGILHSTLPSGIRIRTHLPRDLRAVRADATQISQILLNLCVNARDAMPDGGHLWLRAENLVLDATEATRRNLGRVGPYVVIEVQDEGMGISPDLQKRIFEPFFTTKEAGKGTGLGLSTTLAIVRSHQGVVELESEEGVGSTFRILLPAMEGKASTEAVEDLKSAPRGNGEWILVVDDEASIRAITRDTLETFGYRVISAQDGAEGVARFAERRDEIALVLSDMVMPVLGGEGLVAAVHRLAPNLPVIGMSGSLSPEAHKRSFVDGVTRFLPKPISAVRLLQTVRECLEISA